MIRAACRVVHEVQTSPDLDRSPDDELARLAGVLCRQDPEALRREAKAAAAEHGGAAHAHLARLICNAHATAGGVEIAVGV